MGLLVACIVVDLLVMLLPGYLFIRGLGCPRFPALALSPALSVFELSVVAIAFNVLGISCDVFKVSVVMLGIGIVVFGVSRLVNRGGRAFDYDMNDQSFSILGFSPQKLTWLCFALYLLVGIVLGVAYFLLALETPDCFYEAYDNGFHMNCVRGYSETGVWSPLLASSFPGADEALRPFVVDSGFYPAAWHALCAFSISATGASVPAAINASLFALCFVIWPIEMLFLLRVIFHDRPIPVIFGALVTLAFVAFPWSILTFGPLYPNLAAFCVAPAAMAIFILLTRKGASAGERVVNALLFCVCGASLMLLQPNAVFTCAVFLSGYCVYRLGDLAKIEKFAGRALLGNRVFWSITCAVLIVAAWVVMLNAPLFSAVLSQEYPAYYGKARAFVNGFFLCFKGTQPQIVLAAIVVAGGLRALHERKYLWMLGSYLVAMAMYTVNCSTAGPLKIWLTGFWYSDVYRIAAVVAIVGVPLAALGCETVFNLLFRRAKKGKASLVASLVILGALLFAPNIPLGGDSSIPTPLGSAGQNIKVDYSKMSTGVYTPSEKAFVEKVLQTIPEDSVLVNIPDDGTMFAFGNDGMRTVYRNTRTYNTDSERDQSKVIRNHLSEVSTNKEVQDALKYFGAKYLIMLDQGEDADSSDTRAYLFTWEWYKNDWWTGMTSVTDETPGFKVLLSEGDMRLYEITALD